MHATSTAKQDRLKQAKAEAEREIAQYRATRESNFQKQLADVRARRMCPCSAAIQLSFPASPQCANPNHPSARSLICAPAAGPPAHGRCADTWSRRPMRTLTVPFCLSFIALQQGTDSSSAAAQLERDTDAEVAEVQRQAQANTSSVAAMLTDAVTSC